MVPWQLGEPGAIPGSALQHSQEPLALIDLIPLEPHQQVVRLPVAAGHLQEGFLRRRTELAAKVELLSQFRQQGHGALSGEVVEAQGHQAVAGTAAIGGQQVEFAAQAVAQTQNGFGQVPVPQLAKTPPGGVGLVLVVEAGHITPGPDPPAAGSEGFQQPPVADLGRGRQVTATDELHGAAGAAAGLELPDVAPLAPLRHRQMPNRCRAARDSLRWAAPSSRLLNTCRTTPSPSIT